MKFNMYLAGAAIAFVSTPAFADNTDQAAIGVQGNLTQALEITGVRAIVMPAIVVPVENSATEGLDTIAEVATTGATLSCDNKGNETVSYTPGSNPFAAGVSGATSIGNGTPGSSANWRDGNGLSTEDRNGDCGEISITGESNLAYSFAIQIEENEDNDVTLTEVACSAERLNRSTTSGGGSKLGVLTAGGTDTLYCGATVSVGIGADAADDYSDLSALVTVTYN